MNEKTRKVLTGVAALAAAGGVTAGIAGAAKDDKPFGDRDGMPFGRGHHEAALTGETKEKAEAAALEAVPGGTVLRSEEDSAGTARYEVHMTDADGAPVAVFLDEDFAVVEQRAGHGPRGPGHHGGPGGPRGMHQLPEQLTGATATKAKDAAKAAVADASVRAAFAAPEDADEAYVVIMERKNGRHVIVLLDEQFDVVKKLTRPRFGGPGPRHAGGPPPGMHAPS